MKGLDQHIQDPQHFPNNPQQQYFETDEEIFSSIRKEELHEKQLREVKIKIRGAESVVINNARDVCIGENPEALDKLREAIATLDELYEKAYEIFGLEY